MTAALEADTCPLCLAVHGRLDAYWACPSHGHKLGNPSGTGDFLTYRCPVHGCAYTRSAPRPPRSPSKGDPMTAVQSRPSVPIDQMYARAQHLQQLLPASLDLDSFTGTAQAALYNNADLMAAAEKDPASFMIALTECAALGHYPDGKRYYLTPRGRPPNKVLGVEGYRGIVQRMYNSGLVAKVIVREVCEKDYFDFIEGRDEYPQHRFGNTGERTGAGYFGAEGSVDRGAMVGVYAYAKLLSGEYTRVSLLSREDVHAARAAGGWKASDQYSPWNRMDGGDDHPEFQGRSMWWKTALKRAEPWTPTSSEDKRLAPAATRGGLPPPARPSVTLSAPAAAPAMAGNSKRQAIAQGPQKPPQRSRRDPTAATAETRSTRAAGPSAAERPANGSVVTKALHAAIAQQFDRLGLEDPDEREAYVRKLNKDTQDDLTEHELRFALSTLAEKDDDGGFAIPDLAALVELCNPGPAS